MFPKYGWRNGWFDPEPLRAQAEGLLRDYEPRIPFGVVVTQLRGLHPRLVKYPDVLPAHMQATCSIPLYLPTVRINGKRYLDGGLFEKLPIWAAIEMGAKRIIAIDSLPRVGKWWLHWGIRAAHAFKSPRRYPAVLDLTIITPSEALGDAHDAVFWKRENVERWVGMGTRDATRALASARRMGIPVTEPPGL